MSRVKPLALLALVSVLGLAACSDITAPDQEFCPITGGPGTCAGVVQSPAAN